MTDPRDNAREIIEAWQKKWPAESVSEMTYSPRVSLEDAITAALIEARESALDEAAVAFESNEHNGIWKHAVAMGLRAMKGKP